MKFGEQLEEASVPGWSLHNVDYNSLKHQIKIHTTKDQAAVAIAIPGHQDQALRRFEDAFYLELCSQHDRVGLFVTSKADEISRRLRYISILVQQLILKCTDTRGLSAKRQRRFAKYHAQIEECGQDIKALGRFVDAQVTAFRKILKKYKKWTGSTTLGSRFKDNILHHPKSFTNYNLTPLHTQYHELRSTLEAALPNYANTLESSLPTESHDASIRRAQRDSRRPSHDVATMAPTGYWNEYDHGSEVGDHDDAYVIYIDPNATDEFPGLAYMKNMFVNPVDSVRHWLQSQKSRGTTMTATVSTPSETQSLLGNRTSTSNGALSDYFTARPSATDEPMTEDDYLSSRSSSSVADYKLGLQQDRMLTRAVIVAFLAAFVLLGISSLLVLTGRRRLRLEVDAGAAVGSVASLFCACMGLGAMLYRQHPGSYLYTLAVWITFITVCILNGILLVLVAGSSGL
ncbi:hypothetical protein F5B22DRAFT_22353 [Xylaria bambusicola]|uniref:uncharacterized protein n=1 Tax=Xylaria bambusicola TaxID=326684 RepID=UPI002008089E|nr:uncharacterized protein F5B22DRAFT_22353 [Xylaria bambusicola]KAI0528124.1 hypothetical protein F5B22DRAFT_22353 [Xylaria bambusicola]